MDKLINIKITLCRLLKECKTDQDRLILLQEMGQYIQHHNQIMADRSNIPYIECLSKGPFKHEVAEVTPKPEPTIDVTA